MGSTTKVTSTCCCSLLSTGQNSGLHAYILICLVSNLHPRFHHSTNSAHLFLGVLNHLPVRVVLKILVFALKSTYVCYINIMYVTSFLSISCLSNVTVNIGLIKTIVRIEFSPLGLIV